MDGGRWNDNGKVIQCVAAVYVQKAVYKVREEFHA